MGKKYYFINNGKRHRISNRWNWNKIKNEQFNLYSKYTNNPYANPVLFILSLQNRIYLLTFFPSIVTVDGRTIFLIAWWLVFTYASYIILWHNYLMIPSTHLLLLLSLLAQLSMIMINRENFIMKNDDPV